MAFSWRDFFLLAHELRNSPEESEQRTAIGRAYYYAYNSALTEAQNLGYDANASAQRIAGKRGSGVHQRLWDWCMSHQEAEIRSLGILGSTLKRRRTIADYYLAPNVAITEKVVQQQLDETREFELLLARISQTIPPQPLA